MNKNYENYLTKNNLIILLTIVNILLLLILLNKPKPSTKTVKFILSKKHYLLQQRRYKNHTKVVNTKDLIYVPTTKIDTFTDTINTHFN